MSGIKKNVRKTLVSKGSKEQNEWPLVVYMWMVGLGLTGYLGGEISLSGRPHPYHWLVAFIGGLLGTGIGWLWYRWRGDVKI